MASSNFLLKFRTDLGNTSNNLRRLNIDLDKVNRTTNKTSGSFNKFQKQNRKLNETFSNLHKNANATNESFKSLGKQSLGLKNVISGIGLYRLADGFSTAVASAFDMIETIELFNVAMGDMAQVTDDFLVDMSSITGLDLGNLRDRVGTFNLLGKTMGMTSENALVLSKNANQLALDMGALFNVSYSKVAQDLRSGLIGQSRTMYKYGIDVTESAIAQEALNQGISKSVRHMSQGEKMALRYSIMIQQTSLMHGNFAKTINEPANQLRLLRERFATLSRSIGAVFLPMMRTVINVVNAVVIALIRLFNFIGRLMGIDSQMSDSIGGATSGIGDVSDGVDDVGDSVGKVGSSAKKAEKQAKKLKKQLAGFDEINIIQTKAPETSPSAGGGGGGGGGAGGGDGFGAFDIDLEGYDGMLDKIEQRSEQIADNIVDYFKRVAKVAEPTTEALKRLWEEGLKPMGGFVWDNLGLWYQNFLVPVGTWVLGEQGIPRLINALTNLLSQIDWDTLNEHFGKFYGSLSRFTIGIGNGLILFYEDLFEVLTPIIVSLVERFGLGLDSLADAMDNIPEGKLEQIGYGIGAVSLAFIGWKGIQKILKPIIGIAKILIGKFGGLVGIVELFSSTLGVPLGPSTLLVGALIGIGVAIGDLLLTNENFRDNFKTIWDTLAKTLSSIWENGIKPILNIFKEVILDVYSDGIKPFVEDSVEAIANFVKSISPELEFIFDNLLPKLIDVFELLLKTVGSVVNGALNFLGEFLKGSTKVIDNLMGVFGGIIDFIAGVFTNDWGRAWRGVVNIFKNIINGINNIFGSVINAMIRGVNAMVRGLNKIKMPSWVPGIGGKGININPIPSFRVPQLADGGIIDVGQLFIANEAGPELVGSYGGRSGVMNNDQIVDSVARGVYDAVSSAMAVGGNEDGQQIVVKIGEDTLVNKIVSEVNRESRIQGRTVIEV